MSVRKRTWTTEKGEEKSAWLVDYVDVKGKRRQKTFRLKKEAEDFAAGTRVEIKAGTHVADSDSITVAEAGNFWVDAAENSGLEKSTVDQYRQHVELHITPLIGATTLTKLNIPAVRAFEDDLRRQGRSVALTRKVMVSLGSLLADAQERGLVGRNAVRDMKGNRRGRPSQERKKARLKAGEDIPAPSEVKAMIAALDERWRPVILTAIFCGLRASELRGLSWKDVDLDEKRITVRQRADRFNQIGRPKSAAGERSIPIPPMLLNELRQWKLKCPNGPLRLAFPNGNGNVESLANIRNRGLVPAQVRAGIVNEAGEAKYPGLHSLRHFYASWCINRVEDGGLGLPIKIVQERLGHSTIAMTADRYGHLFPRGNEADEMAEAEALLFFDAT